jgi:hypothetical protein
MSLFGVARPLAGFVWGITAVLLAACGGERAPVSWSAAVDTIGDTIVVRSTGSVWGDTAELVSQI